LGGDHAPDFLEYPWTSCKTSGKKNKLKLGVKNPIISREYEKRTVFSGSVPVVKPLIPSTMALTERSKNFSTSVLVGEMKWGLWYVRKLRLTPLR
jgi:hypothetical protein